MCGIMAKKYKIVLPASGPKPSYYEAYVGYIENLFLSPSFSIEKKGVVNGTKFIMSIDSINIVIDYSDHPDIKYEWLKYPYFKFHYNKKKFEKFENVHPFSPISFYDWNKFNSIKNSISYTCGSNYILNMQEAKANALERRNYVHNILVKEYKSFVVIQNNMTQIDYWKKINDCLVHVFVPGARNDMLDRGHMQYLAFGCCTIAPPIVDELPYEGKMIDNVNYIQCAEDYSDLIEKIEWCKSNKEKCIEIGQNAKKMFDECCTPQRLWQWILEKI